jgi:isoleucyl-tRNA synthetase
MKAEPQIHPFHRTLDDPIISPNRNVRDDNLLTDLPWLLNANTAVKTAQEEARGKKIIGSSLESSVVLQLPSQALGVFERYADELETIFVVSSVKSGGEVEGAWKYCCDFDVPGGKGTAWVVPPEEHKCPRCWRYVAPVEDELCTRCEEVFSVS